jgi:hypothetical protein
MLQAFHLEGRSVFQTCLGEILIALIQDKVRIFNAFNHRGDEGQNNIPILILE